MTSRIYILNNTKWYETLLEEWNAASKNNRNIIIDSITKKNNIYSEV